MKVLVIDDDRSFPVEVLALLLGVCWPDSAVLAARTGEEGWRLFLQEAPDFVLLNVAVPGGRDVLRDFRHIYSYQAIQRPRADRGDSGCPPARWEGPNTMGALACQGALDT